MTSKKNIKASALFALLGFVIFHHQARAASIIGTPVIEVCELSALKGDATRREVAVYGEVLFLNHDTVLFRDKDYHRHWQLVDIGHMRGVYREQLSRRCSRSGCSEIMTVLVAGTKLRAITSYNYKSPYQSPAACRRQ